VNTERNLIQILLLAAALLPSAMIQAQSTCTTFVFANTNTILFPDPAAPNPPYPPQTGPGKPYPSVIGVTNLTGMLTKVTLTLSNLSHTYSGDVNVLLVAPGGTNALVLSHAGDQPVAGLNLTIDDFAPSPLPGSGALFFGHMAAERLWRKSVFSDKCSCAALRDPSLRIQLYQSKRHMVALCI